MASGFFIAMVVIAIAGVGYGMYMADQIKGSAPTVTDMQPTSLDDFQITKVSEGVVVPIIFGRIRLSGNLIYYGGLRSQPNKETQTSQVPDGKSTKTVTQTYIASYTYYINMWQLLCKGPAVHLKTWINDAAQEMPANNQYWLTGENNALYIEGNPVVDDEITPLEGLASIYANSVRLGVNSTMLQTMHFLMESVPNFTFAGNKECVYGLNPAFIIWCLLIEAGADRHNMNEESFVAASEYWKLVDYGLNISLTRQGSLRVHIQRVLGYVGGYFGLDSENKFRLKAFNPEEEAVRHLTQDDFVDFQITRKTWSDTSNTFTANYLDEELEYTKRTVSIVNTGNLNIQGFTKPRSIDLSAFRNRESAEKRLWEVMKDQSYPSATISFTSFLHLSKLEIGDVVTVSHSEYDLDAAYYRITTKAMKEIDKNEISWVAAQIVERVFDGNFVATDGASWTIPTQMPEGAEHQRIYELPYNPITKRVPSFLLLSTKGAHSEIGFVVMTSLTSGADYTNQGVYGGNSVYGTLKDVYPSTTYEIDDTLGILFHSDSADLTYYDDISRPSLFSNSRFALIGNELITFETITPEGFNDEYRLKGVIRGIYNTTKASHAINEEIWIFSMSGNIFATSNTVFYLKMIPATASAAYDAALTAEFEVNTTFIAQNLVDIQRIEAVRTATDVSLRWWNVTKDTKGAGTFDAGSPIDTDWPYTDEDPFLFDGYFEYRIDSGYWVELYNTELNIVSTSPFLFEVREVGNSQLGNVKALTVGVSDGSYVS